MYSVVLAVRPYKINFLCAYYIYTLSKIKQR